MSFRRAGSFSFLVLLLTLTGVQAQESRSANLPDPNDENAPPIMKAELISVFSKAPPSGFCPVILKVENKTDSNSNFSIKAKSTQGNYRQENSLSAAFSAQAGANKTSSSTFLVPVLPDHDGSISSHHGYGYRYGSPDFQVEASGPIKVELTMDVAGNNSMPAVALSNGLTNGRVDELNRNRFVRISGSASSYYGGESAFAAQYRAEDLPPDWRAFSGFDIVAMNSTEWLALAPGVRDAALQYVKIGGKLRLYTSATDTADSLRLPVEVQMKELTQLGFGSIELASWSGALDPKEESSFPDTGARAVRFDQEAVTTSSWSNLRAAFGIRSFGAWQVGLVLVLFGILVGPVNLFRLAPAGQRHKLFFTTPLISLAAAMILVLVILFQDGTGGSGTRQAVVYLSPTDASAFVHQQDLSRTGVLFGSKFKVEEPAIVSPVLIDSESRWTRLKGSNRDGAPQSYTHDGDNQLAGDWFQSRSEQAIAFEFVRPTRAKLHLTGDAASPSLRSDLPFLTEKIFYRDAAGKLWESQGALETGKTTGLVESPGGSLEKWMSANPRMKDHFPRKAKSANILPAGHFMTITKDPKAGLTSSLESISWENDLILVWGPLATNP